MHESLKRDPAQFWSRDLLSLGAALAFGLSAVGVAMIAHAQQPGVPPAASQSQSPPDLPKVYMPGLGEFMLVVQTHHAKMWFAARAHNWPLVAYQLSEMKEVLDEVRELVPVYRNVPVGQMVDAITTGPIAELEKAVEEKKLRNFTVAYGKLTRACNDCHRAAGRGFIVIQRPTRPEFPNQEFLPSRR
jgi:hypothetical protein